MALSAAISDIIEPVGVMYERGIEGEVDQGRERRGSFQESGPVGGQSRKRMALWFSHEKAGARNWEKTRTRV